MIISAPGELYARRPAAPRRWAWRIVCSFGDFPNLILWLNITSPVSHLAFMCSLSLTDASGDVLSHRFPRSDFMKSFNVIGRGICPLPWLNCTASAAKRRISDATSSPVSPALTVPCCTCLENSSMISYLVFRPCTHLVTVCAQTSHLQSTRFSRAPN